MSAPLWVFGYGSLVWRPAIPYIERRPGHIRGWARRFWQGSPDHRGVPERPGRVVTLVPEPGAVCWGMGYRLDPTRAGAVLAALDHREKAGYLRVTETFTHDTGCVDALVYIAGADNPDFLGPASLADIATQVRTSTGPSGDNVEYVLELAGALRAMGADDAHVFALAALLAASAG